MIKILLLCSMFQNPEFLELQFQNAEFSELEIYASRKRGKQNRSRKRGGGGLR
tara:strand:+ start:990 stop:1148 length:159 start_codon:yes stop_codon:yes gene_type:complete